MTTLTECADSLARRMLSDIYLHGGAIMFFQPAIDAGLVEDVTHGKWYQLTAEVNEAGVLEGYHFVDDKGECNYAGQYGSRVYQHMPNATLTCPF